MYDFTGPVLGAGAFATVLLVKDRMSGLEYALKQVSVLPVAATVVSSHGSDCVKCGALSSEKTFGMESFSLRVSATLAYSPLFALR